MEGPQLARWAFVRLAFPHLSGMPSFTFLTLFSFLVNVQNLAARSATLCRHTGTHQYTEEKNPKKGLWLLGAAPAQRLE